MKFKMLDGSVYEENNKSWVKAIGMRKKQWKAQGKKQDWGSAFAVVVERHFGLKTIPNKFGSDDKWDKDYKTHAELAPKIMYLQLRAILMGMMMANYGGKVLAIGRNGAVTEYPSGKRTSL